MASAPPRKTTGSGPFKGVRRLTDPFAVPAGYLCRARNIYLPDPKGGCGAYQRPGFSLANADAPLADVATGRIGQAVETAWLATGEPINFVVCGGRLFRVSADLGTRTDVTPVGITIDATARVYLTPFSNRLVVNDGVNTPWVASDLTATPVTGTKINYDSLGTAWVAYGPGVVWGGSIFFVVRSIGADPSQKRTVRAAWSEADDPFTGYKQTDFDNEWDIVQNGDAAIFALVGTNGPLWYFRDGSVGYLNGTVGPDLSTTATHDAVEEAEGTHAPASIQQFGNGILFVDQAGRVMRIANGQLAELWLQQRATVTEARTRWPDITARVASSVIVPELDIYLAGIWSPDPANAVLQFPTELFAYNARSAIYLDEWTVGPGIAVHAMGRLIGLNGEPQLVVLGSKTAPAVGAQALGDGGYLWAMSAVDDDQWTDNGVLPDVFADVPINRSANTVSTIDQGLALVGYVEPDPPPDLVPASITIAPTTFICSPGNTQQETAVVRNAAGEILDLVPDTWESTHETFVTVDSDGLITAVAFGAAVVRARITTPPLVSNDCAVTVQPPIPVSITIEAAVDVEQGLTVQLTATVLDALGNVLVGVPLTWTTSSGAAITVDASGLLTGVGIPPATANIQAHYAGGISIGDSPVNSNVCVASCVKHWIVHTFTVNDNFVVSSGSGNVELLLAGGGGSGGSVDGTGVGGGGGGAGAAVHVASLAVAPGSYPVSLGGGGIAPHADHFIGMGAVAGNNGTATTGFGRTAGYGGGGGAADATIARRGRAGGLGGGSGGGGGSAGDTSPPAGTYDGGAAGSPDLIESFGHAGGNGSNAPTVGAVGGGASAGGLGITLDIESIPGGTTKTYAIGGAARNGPGGAVTANMGHGGEGGGLAVFCDGSAGSSGRAVIRYALSTGIVATGGTKVTHAV